MITWHIDSHSHHGDQVNRWSRHLERYFQSSYLSKYHKLYFVEKKLSCGEIMGNFENFWEILPQFTRFHVEKN